MGILDNIDYGDPKTAALLGLAQGLLSAGAPHSTPVSFTGALGQGVSGALSAASEAQKYSYLAQQAQALKYANALSQAKADELAKGASMPYPVLPGVQNVGSGGGGGSGGGASPIVNPDANNVYGSPLTTPPSVNQSVAPAAPSVTPASSSYFDPQALYEQGRRYLLLGIPGGAAMMESAINHDPSITGPVALAGQGYRVGRDGVYQLAPGIAAGKGDIAGAEANAKLPSEAVTSFLRYAGRPTAYNPFKEKIEPGYNFLPPSIQNIIQQGLKGATLSQQSPTTGSPTQGQGNLLSPLETASQTKHGEELETESKALRDSANNAVSMNYNLDQMRTALSGFKPGPGTNLQMFLEKNLSILGKPFGVEPPSSLGSYQEFSKYANQIAFAATRQMGAREAAQVVKMQIESNPNSELTPQAVNGLMNSMQSMNDYIISKSKGEQAWRTTHRGTTDGFNSYWLEHYDPRAWQFMRMSPDEQRSFANSISPSEAGKLKQKILNAQEDGWLK